MYSSNTKYYVDYNIIIMRIQGAGFSRVLLAVFLAAVLALMGECGTLVKHNIIVLHSTHTAVYIII